jgi:glycerol-3-phosphate dehydrogenase (NAD(P)+)
MRGNALLMYNEKNYGIEAHMGVITIVGAGMMGSAMSFPARANGHEVRLVGTHLDRAIIEQAARTGEHLTLKRKLPDGIIYYQIENVKEALQGADAVVCGVSSFGVDWFGGDVVPIIPDDMPILAVTKGMSNEPDGSLVPYPVLYARRFPGKSFSAVGGPCTSYELADRDPTEVCFCGGDMPTLRMLKALFETDFYHISLSNDIVGVECAVAMKNAYALGVSLAIGLSERREGTGGREHYNSQAALFGQSIREMRRLLKLVGGGDDNIAWGAGDLYVTVFGGRTRRIGILLGSGLSFDEAMKELQGVTLESVVIAGRTAEAVRALIGRSIVRAEDFPLLLHIDDVIRQGAVVDIPWVKFETEAM